MSKQHIAKITDKARQLEYLNDFRKQAWAAMCEVALMRDIFDPNGYEYEKKITGSGGEALCSLFGKISRLLCEAETLAGIDAAELQEAIQGAATRNSTDTAQDPFALENALMEILEYAALLDDLTTRSVSSGMDFTTDGLCGLNRLASHMHGLAVEALGNLPNAQEARP